MNLYDITSLQRDPNQNNLYDLTAVTFILQAPGTNQVVVTQDQEMRIDLISYSIYNTTDYADLLLDLNNIDNPLNILTGDVIQFIALDQLNYYRQTISTIQSQRNILLSPNKSSKISSSRQQYLENNYQLPPTFLQNPGSPITTSGGNVTISPII